MNVALLGPAVALMLAPPAAHDGLARAEAAIEQGRLTQARVMIERLAPVPAIATEIRRLTAELALAERDDRGAFAALAGLPDTANDCRVDESFGVAALRVGRMAEAHAALERSTASCPDRWRGWNALGVIYDRLARWDDSERSYARALALTGGSATVTNNIGVSLMLQRRHAEALAILNRAAAAAPSNERIANNIDIAGASAGQAPAPTRETQADRARRLGNAGYAAYLAGDRVRARAYLSQAIHLADRYSARAAGNLSLMDTER